MPAFDPAIEFAPELAVVHAHAPAPALVHALVVVLVRVVAVVLARTSRHCRSCFFGLGFSYLHYTMTRKEG